jgi:hypothetical protein
MKSLVTVENDRSRGFTTELFATLAPQLLVHSERVVAERNATTFDLSERCVTSCAT